MKNRIQSMINNRRVTMKKISCLILVSMLILSILSGCGQSTPQEGSQGSGSETSSGAKDVLYIRKTASLQSTDWEATTNTAPGAGRRRGTG